MSKEIKEYYNSRYYPMAKSEVEKRLWIAIKAIYPPSRVMYKGRPVKKIALSHQGSIEFYDFLYTDVLGVSGRSIYWESPSISESFNSFSGATYSFPCCSIPFTVFEGDALKFCDGTLFADCAA